MTVKRTRLCYWIARLVWWTVLLLSCCDCDSTQQHYDVMRFECILWHFPAIVCQVWFCEKYSTLQQTSFGLKITFYVGFTPSICPSVFTYHIKTLQEESAKKSNIPWIWRIIYGHKLPYMKKTKITLYEEDKKEEASMRCSLLHGSWDQILRRRPSRIPCPLCSSYSPGWILSILGTNDH